MKVDPSAYTVDPSAYSNRVHNYNTSNGPTSSIGTVILLVKSQFFPPTYMKFSITVGGAIIIGRPQILTFSNQTIIDVVRHEEQYNQLHASPSHLSTDIHQFIVTYLSPTIPFRQTDYSFSLGTLVNPKC